MATSHKIDIWSRVGKHLGGEKFAFFVPKCVITELRALGTAVEDALEFALSNCEVVDDVAAATAGSTPLTPTEAIKALVGTANPRKFLVATQEDELRDHLRRMAGVPLLHIQRTVLLLEAPSSSSRRTSDHAEASKLRSVTAGEVDAVTQANKMRHEARAEKRRVDGAASGFKPVKVKAKGPNPLSMMKKKEPKQAAAAQLKAADEKAGAAGDGAEEEKKKRRRRKKAKEGGAEDS